MFSLGLGSTAPPHGQCSRPSFAFSPAHLPSIWQKRPVASRLVANWLALLQEEFWVFFFLPSGQRKQAFVDTEASRMSRRARLPTS